MPLNSNLFKRLFKTKNAELEKDNVIVPEAKRRAYVASLKYIEQSGSFLEFKAKKLFPNNELKRKLYIDSYLAAIANAKTNKLTRKQMIADVIETLNKVTERDQVNPPNTESADIGLTNENEYSVLPQFKRIRRKSIPLKSLPRSTDDLDLEVEASFDKVAPAA